MLKQTDPGIIAGHLEDSSNLSGGFAEGIYQPENGQEVIESLRECNASNTPLTVSGGETGTTGGCIPFGGWLLSIQKLNKIIKINTEVKFAVVQPGTTLQEIENAVSKLGLLYPPDPTEKSATIGGNVSTNASGGRCFRFGATRNWIRRLKIVLPGGNILNIKRDSIHSKENGKFILPNLQVDIPSYKMPKTKNAAGYFSAPGMYLLDLFIGSEGTLGIITEVEIGLVPAMQETFDLVAFFPSEEDAVNFVLENKKRKDPSINFYEFFDNNTLQMLKVSYPHIPEKAKAAIYIEQEINEINYKTYLETWGKTLEKHKASPDDCWTASDPKQKEELLKFRHAIPEHINELFKKNHQVKLASDIAVPGEKFKEMFEFYNSSLVTRHSSLFYIKFGHIGDNHLHVNLLAKSADELKEAKELVLKFVRKAVELGGTVSAEHGIGKIKHDYLKEMYGEKGIKEMVRLKKEFDPKCILGLNNIFSKELLAN